MPRRRSSFVGVRGAVRAPRRQTTWFGSVDENAFTAVGGGIVDFQGQLNAAALARRPFTITRVVGYISMISDQVAAAEEPFGAWGLAVVSDQAVAAGVASLPSPISEQDSELWLAFQGVAAPVNAAGVTANPSTVYFDSRGQRKVEQGMDVVSVFENASSTSGLLYVVKFRMLVKLH